MNIFCETCGAKLINGVCPNCSKVQTMPQYQPQQSVANVDPNDERFKSFFMSPKEKFVCALGNGYLMNFLAGGFLGNGFAVISDKRVYFKGKSYEIGEKKVKVRTSASTVDLKDITGTEVRTIKHIELIITGCLIAILGIILCIATSFVMPILSAFSAIIILVGVLLFIYYFISRKTVLTIMFGGGGIAFPLNWYPVQEGNNFQKMLRITKDKAIEEAENATANAVREAMSVSAQSATQAAVSSADELAKYAQLYKDGLISEQEFADIKAKIFSK